MNSTIYVQAVFHKADKHKKSICKDLKEKGWEEYRLSGSSGLWKGDSDKLNCNKTRELELKAERDFFTCAVIYRVKMTLVYEVKRKSEYNY